MLVTPETTVVRDERGLVDPPPRPPRRPLRRPRSSCCLATGAAMTDEAATMVVKAAAANRILKGGGWVEGWGGGEVEGLEGRLDEEQTSRWLQARPFMLSGRRDPLQKRKRGTFHAKMVRSGRSTRRESVGFSARDQRSG